MRIVGIDPGVYGALALLENGKLTQVLDMPTIEVTVGKSKRKRLIPSVLDEQIHILNPELVILEQVGTRTGEGAVGAFTFGRGFGLIEGILAARRIPCQYVLPATWKRALGIPADKDGARLKACALFPYKATEFARKKDDGRAEASLIALYGSRVTQ